MSGTSDGQADQEARLLDYQQIPFTLLYRTHHQKRAGKVNVHSVS